MDPAYRYQI